MSELGLFLTSVAVLASTPLVIASLRGSFRAVLLYAYLSVMVVLGGMLGPVYLLHLGGDVQVWSGQVFYGAFVYTTILTTIVGRDLQVVRKIIAVVVVVGLVAVIGLELTHAGLTTTGVTNPYGAPPELFAASATQQVTSALLSILELVLLLSVLEWTKARLGSTAMVPVYPLAFVAILVIDGIFFPALVLRPDTGLADIVAAGVETKLALAAAYSVPLMAFVLLNRRTLKLYETQQLGLRYLADLSRDPLLVQLDEQRTQLVTTTATAAGILDAATSTVLVTTDPELVITRFNAGAERILDRDGAEVIGQRLDLLVSADEVAQQAAALGVVDDLRVVGSTQASLGRPHDWRLRRADGVEVVLSLNITRIVTDGQLVGYLFAGEDVTARILAENALLGALNHEQQSKALLLEADQVKQQLVSTVSHELRTPIASIRGYVELLIDGDFGELKPEQAAAIERVMRNSERLGRLVSDLLILERSEAGTAIRRRQPVDVCGVIRDCLDLLHEQTQDHRLELDLPDEPVLATGDADSIQRVVLNLVDNAVKFTPVSGTVHLRVRSLDHGARIDVVDTGIGIRPEDREQLFSRFYRAPDAVAMEAQGTGLGLAIVQAIVREHQGNVQVESEPGRGSTFTVELPV